MCVVTMAALLTLLAGSPRYGNTHVQARMATCSSADSEQGDGDLIAAQTYDAVEQLHSTNKSYSGVWIELRIQGKRIGNAWSEERVLEIAITDAVRRAHVMSNSRDVPTEAVLFITEQAEHVPRSQYRRVTTNVHRGVLGYEATAGQNTVRLSPLETIATNRDTRKALDMLVGKDSARLADLDSLHTLHGSQYFIRLG